LLAASLSLASRLSSRKFDFARSVLIGFQTFKPQFEFLFKKRLTIELTRAETATKPAEV